jgi:ketosteroid isomerase-like protein
MPGEREELLRDTYDAFNTRDIERALTAMHPDVDWPNGMEGGRVQGHDGVREYWTRQFGMIDSHVTPERIELQEDGTLAVEVHAVVRDLDGAEVSNTHLRHVYSFREGLVQRMDIEESP